MSDLLNQASLVMVPSGYKEDTVYSVVPTDGSGDLTFTRASNGTRVNSAGLVEVTPWNLLTYSEDFSNTSSWTQDPTSGSITITANYATAPNGTNTADRIQITKGVSYSQLYQTSSVISGAVYTISVYLKSLSGTPTITTLYDSGVKGTQTLTTDWVRYTFSFTATSNTIYPMIALYSGNSASMDILAWGYQLNIGSTAKPYFPTTDRLNVPRLTYQNGGGGCPSLLLEKQSTNQFTYSEQFDNAGWTKTNTSITANSAISPDGTQNADTVANTGTNNTPELFQLYSGASSSTAYTFSCYMKANTHTKGVLRAYNGGSTTTPLVLFDLSAGTVIASYGNATNTTITNVGNGWYRCSMTFTTISATVGIYGHITNLSNTYTYQSSFNYVENYNNTGSIYIWGAQLEASSYVTSYIGTTSSSATRVADACYKTGISSLIGQTSGALFVEFNSSFFESYTQRIFTLSDGTISNVIGFQLTGANELVFYVENGGTNQVVINKASPAITLGSNVKIAAAYANNDFVFYVNGTQIGTDTSGSVPATSQLRFSEANASAFYLGLIKQVCLFPTRLTNAELASLTTI